MTLLQLYNKMDNLDRIKEKDTKTTYYYRFVEPLIETICDEDDEANATMQNYKLVNAAKAYDSHQTKDRFIKNGQQVDTSVGEDIKRSPYRPNKKSDFSKIFIDAQKQIQSENT